MKPWLNSFLRNLLGAAKPTAPIVKNRIRLLVELLEDRLIARPCPRPGLLTWHTVALCRETSNQLPTNSISSADVIG